MPRGSPRSTATPKPPWKLRLRNGSRFTCGHGALRPGTTASSAARTSPAVRLATFPHSMKLRLTAALLFLCVMAIPGVAATEAATPVKPSPIPASAPAGFFGIAPQTELTEEDMRYMSAGGIETVRIPVAWSAIQPTRKSGYDWEGMDRIVELAARQGLRVLPDLYSTPAWLGKPTALPTQTAAAREAGPPSSKLPSGATGRAANSGVSTRPLGSTTKRRSGRRCRSAPGRSGTRSTSSTSPCRSPQAATRGS